MDLWHVTIATVDRAPLHRSEEALLTLVRMVDRVIGHRLVLFCVADDHFHLVLEGPQPAIAVAGLSCALTWGVSVDIARPFLKQVADRAHLATLVGYVLAQPVEHGFGSVATWPGSCLADLVGARRLGRFGSGPLRSWLPRWRAREICRVARIAVPQPVTDLAGCSLARIHRASRLALAAPVSGKSLPAVRARWVAAHLAREAGYGVAAIARELERHPAHVSAVLRKPVPEEVAEARIQLALLWTRSHG